MKEFTKSVVSKFDTKTIKRIKYIVLFVFAGLIILDIIFVLPNGFPTISQVVYDSSPKYMVLIWFFGLFVTNVFFQKIANHKFNFKKNFIILSIITLLFIVAGFTIKQPTHITCDNYKTEIKKAEIKYVTRVLCQDYTNGLTEYTNCNCNTLKCDENIHFKLDITVQIKFLILLLGIILGYFLWPYIEENKT